MSLALSVSADRFMKLSLLSRDVTVAPVIAATTFAPNGPSLGWGPVCIGCDEGPDSGQSRSAVPTEDDRTDMPPNSTGMLLGDAVSKSDMSGRYGLRRSR